MAAFGSLSDRLNDTFDRLRGKGKLYRGGHQRRHARDPHGPSRGGRQLPRGEGLRHAHQGALPHRRGHDLLTPAQNVVKIVLDELTELLGGTEEQLVLSSRIPDESSCSWACRAPVEDHRGGQARLHAQEAGQEPAARRVRRVSPGGCDQLATLGGEIGVPAFRCDGAHPVDIAKAVNPRGRRPTRDVVIVDTVVVSEIDEQMMQEAVDIKKAVKPDQVLMVVDAMTGQDIVNVVSTFAERTDFDGVIISSLTATPAAGRRALGARGDRQAHQVRFDGREARFARGVQPRAHGQAHPRHGRRHRHHREGPQEAATASRSPPPSACCATASPWTTCWSR